jgi:uncharacterized protein (DUF302 family)
VDEVPTQAPVSGVRTLPSPVPFDATVERLTGVIERFGLRLFAVIDHGGGAREFGLEMNDAKVLIFGHPLGGTPVMVAAPLAALDLPLRVLVWADGRGLVQVSHHENASLGDRYGVPADLLAPLSMIDAVVAEALAPVDSAA